MTIAIGIDLGTTYSCVAAVVHGRLQVLVNAEGEQTTPSCVAFTGERFFVGNAAVSQALVNPRNTVFGVKRLMSKKFDDESVQKDIRHWPFKVVPGSDGRAAVEVDYKGTKRRCTPESISAAILGKMKDVATRRLQAEVTKAVITVPAYFNDAQRQATFDAGRIAGLDVLRIINEPTAAALAYGVQRPSDEKRKVLVFDFGGGTFDITILDIHGTRLEVVGTGGDTHLGGEDFVNLLVDHCVREFKSLNHDIATEPSPKAMQKLRETCEEAKIALSDSSTCRIEVEDFCENISLDMPLHKEEFEDLCEPLFKKAIATLSETLVAAKTQKDAIDEILLVGGTTRIPRMREVLSEFFGGKDLSRTVPPDHAVAIGAAVQAAILTGNKSFGDVRLEDVIPLSLGVLDSHGAMNVAIARNSRIPTSHTKKWVTSVDNQTVVGFKIYEGEHELAEKNNYLGKLRLAGLMPAPRGEMTMEATLRLDANGVLSITAVDLTTKNQNSSIIAFDKGRLSEPEIQRMIHEAEQFREDERRVIERNKASSDLEYYCTKIKRQLSDPLIKTKLDANSVRSMEAKLAGTSAKLITKRATKEEIVAWHKELANSWDSMTEASSSFTGTGLTLNAGTKRKPQATIHRSVEDAKKAKMDIEFEKNECDSDDDY